MKRQRSFSTTARSGKRRTATTQQQKLESEVRRAMMRMKSNQELKFYDTAANTVSVSTSGVVLLATNIAVGTAQTQRIGQKVTVKSHLLRYTLTAADSTQSVRVVIARYMDNGNPTIADLLQDTVTNPWLSPLDRDKGHRFSVLFDKMHALGTYTDANICEKVYLSGNWDVHWNASAVNEKGGLYIFVISDSGVASHPSIDYSSRVRFVDL